PGRPVVMFPVRVLDFYRVAHARCPQMSIQPFIKTLCNTHGVYPRPFSIAYNLYLNLCRLVEKAVLTHLGHDNHAWRIKNWCPACTCELEGESDLIFKMLVCMDRNNSLKRILWREPATNEGPGWTSERTDTQDAGDGYYLERETINKWDKDRVAETLLPNETQLGNLCQSRWKNMAEDITAKMWSVFDETGIFLCLCRHSFVMMMVRSGEL
ncbi:hypothetical protein GGX14DRAFT_373040, partial [Mycena pura]